MTHPHLTAAERALWDIANDATKTFAGLDAWMFEIRPNTIQSLLSSLDAARVDAERFRAALTKIASMDQTPYYGGGDPAFGHGYDMAAMSAADEARAALTPAAQEPKP